VGAVAEAKCSKCGSGAVYLFLRDYRLEGGDRVQEVACRRCGEVLARREVFAPRVVVAADQRDQEPASQHRTERGETMQRIRRRHIVENTHPCPVPGCDGTFYPPKNHFGLCKQHSNVLHTYIRRRDLFFKGMRPSQPFSPPVWLVNGVWINRGDPLPGISGAEDGPWLR